MKHYFIDCKKFTSRPSAHEEIALSMSLPSYYGHNLDALWDILTEITSETLIVLCHAGYADINTLPVIVLFHEAAEENGLIKVVEV